jgi:hypothetical protein
MKRPVSKHLVVLLPLAAGVAAAAVIVAGFAISDGGSSPSGLPRPARALRAARPAPRPPLPAPLAVGRSFAAMFNGTPPLTTRIIDVFACSRRGPVYRCAFTVRTPRGIGCVGVELTLAWTNTGWQAARSSRPLPLGPGRCRR